MVAYHINTKGGTVAKPRTQLDLGALYQFMKSSGGVTARQVGESGVFNTDRRTIQYWMRRLANDGFVSVKLIPGKRRRVNCYTLIDGTTEDDFINARKPRKHRSEIWNRLPTMTDAEFEELVWKWADERLAKELHDDARIRSGNDTAGADSWLGTGIW